MGVCVTALEVLRRCQYLCSTYSLAQMRHRFEKLAGEQQVRVAAGTAAT